jgi:hypothetical protein
MALVVEKYVEQMPEGLHHMTITRVEDLGEQVTRFGPKVMAAIYFTSDDGQPDVCMRVVQSLHPNSTLVKLLGALSISVGDKFDLTELVGIHCQVVIQHKEKDGGIDATVASVLKVRKRVGTRSPRS